MRIILLHSDFIEFKAVSKALKTAEETNTEKERFEECLVVLTAVEKRDEGTDVALKVAEEIQNVADQVKTKNVVIYPWVHLSSEPSSPKEAQRVLKETTEAVKKAGYMVANAPFGWYKSLNVSCKGHPLSELSREIYADDGEKDDQGFGEKYDDKIKKGEEKFIVLTKEGEEYTPEEYIEKFGNESELGVMIEKEALKIDRTKAGEPEYHKVCRKYGIAWEPMSDNGHLRYGPLGNFLFDIVADYATQVTQEVGIPVYNVRGTSFFNLEEGAVAEHAKLFGDRLYTVKSGNRKFVLRYAACHQQFAMIKDWVISYKHLPFAAFEVADSYRYEQSGEMLLCFRMRRFYMPDMHVFCRTYDEGKEWFKNVNDKIYEKIRDLGRDYEMLFNFSAEEHYRKDKDWVVKLLKSVDKDALLHFYPEGINYYWTVNIEHHILDDMNRPREIGTVQIDIGNSERFGMNYTDEKGQKQDMVILHTAMIGGIERFLYTVFDTAIKKEKECGRVIIPLWLNPEQVRVVPIRESHIEDAMKIAKQIENENIRVGFDDTNETLGKKVMSAKKDWVSYVLVVGDKELESGQLDVYDRETNKNIKMPISDLIKQIKEKTKGKPFKSMYVPMELSKRPVFS
ncbi:hypothetical protein KO465_05060 [Candidatus Micrarchaeota archaeon]|nr:hypothetical protein [Candidatus Micrarchaeota archaeon]